MQLVERVAARLREEQLPFALIGAGALAVHGAPRATQDTDLFVVSRRVLDQREWQALADAGVEIEVRIGDSDDPLQGVVCFTSGDQALDLVVGKYAWQNQVLERAKSFQLGSVELPVVSPGDLVLLKLYAGGPQDRWDVAQLLKTDHMTEIVLHVEQYLDDLPSYCRDLWDKVRSTD